MNLMLIFRQHISQFPYTEKTNCRALLSIVHSRSPYLPPPSTEFTLHCIGLSTTTRTTVINSRQVEIKVRTYTFIGGTFIKKITTNNNHRARCLFRNNCSVSNTQSSSSKRSQPSSDQVLLSSLTYSI